MISSKQRLKLRVAIGLFLFISACATKKHVREAIAPVQQQVTQVQKDAASNKTAIGDLDRSVASADEKAQDAGRRAQDAANAAAQANSAAQQAGSRADAANSLAQQAMNNANQVNQNLQTSLQNLDNYNLANTVQVYFNVGQSMLSKEAKQQLDQAVSNAGNDYLIEVEGFTDKTGSKAYNLELARRRADAVVRYLTVEKNIPLRDIRMLGVGSEFPNADNKTRAARQSNRRVKVNIYSHNLRTGQTETAAIPKFPWPPPAASARQVLPSRFFKGATVRDLDEALKRALDSNGYVEKSYYTVPHGFALVTRLEQIRRNGRSQIPPARWSAESHTPDVFSLSEYLLALFTAEPGYYRLIVFIITDVPFVEQSQNDSPNLRPVSCSGRAQIFCLSQWRVSH